MIKEVIEEEDEDKNNIIKENDIKKEKVEKKINNEEKFKKIVIKNITPFNSINTTNLQNTNNEIHNKPNLIWSNSPFNKKINTYENLLYKKTFDKYVSVRDKLIPNNKNSHTGGIILPDLRNINNNYQSLNIKKPFNSPKLNLRSLSTDKAKLQQNINSITNDTSAFTHSSKKCFSPIGLGIQNYTEDVSKYRMGLLSAGSSSNNNIIIPMIPIRRPVSNFNFGGGQLWNNYEDSNKNINNKNIIDKDMIVDDDKNDNKYLKKEDDNNNLDVKFQKKELTINLNNIKSNYNIYNKLSGVTKTKLFKSQDMKHQLEVCPLKNNINNLYLDKMINKLHKIKIEKGMMNSDIMNSLNEKFNNDYQSQIEQFKKSHLPMMFNNQNNKFKNMNLNNISIDKNKRSHSFNNRNNFH